MDERWTNWVGAKDETSYYRCFDRTTQPDPDPDTSYEKWYQPLMKRMRLLLEGSGVPTASIELFEPWVPNRTREVAIDAFYVSPERLALLGTLLTGEYSDWRLGVTLVDSIQANNTLGAVAIYSDWVLCFGVGRLRLPTVG